MDYRRNGIRNIRPPERSVCAETVGSARRFCESENSPVEEMRSSCGCGREAFPEPRDCDFDREYHSDCDSKVLDTNLIGAPLAMVYSPFQRFDDLFEPEEALCHGTLFRELYKPFVGSRRGV